MELLNNRYQRIYQTLCERARGRELDDYTEKHHVVPKSLGGDSSASNLVRLTAREHYIAHLCLVRCTTGADRRKMVWAAHYMRYGRGAGKEARRAATCGRLYEVNKREKSRLSRGPQGPRGPRGYILRQTPEHVAHRSAALKGRNPYVRTEAHSEKQREVQKGIKKPAIAEANRRRVGMRYRKHIPSCHPKRILYGNGLCEECYHKKYYQNENAVG
jgi:hypothetical protein